MMSRHRKLGTKNTAASLACLQEKPYINARSPAISNKV